ncbi:MAG: hypothetical protein GY817_02060 [bacterium]|nr:hypothetical protein [bacterium]
MYNTIYVFLCKILILVFILGLSSCINSKNLKNMNSNKVKNRENSSDSSYIPRYVLPVFAAISQFCNTNTKESIPNRNESTSEVITNTCGKEKNTNTNHQDKNKQNCKTNLPPRKKRKLLNNQSKLDLKLYRNASKTTNNFINRRNNSNDRNNNNSKNDNGNKKNIKHQNKTDNYFITTYLEVKEKIRKKAAEINDNLSNYNVNLGTYKVRGKKGNEYVSFNDVKSIGAALKDFEFSLYNRINLDEKKKISSNLIDVIFSYYFDNILDHIEESSLYNHVLYKKLKLLGYFHSQKVIEEKILKNPFFIEKNIFNNNDANIKTSLIDKLVREFQLNELWLLLSHPHYRNLEIVKDNMGKNYNPYNTALKLFEKFAPKLGPGLNIGGSCTNDNCDLNGNTLWINLGFKGKVKGEQSGFNIGDEGIFNCSMCNEVINAKKFVIVNSKYEVKIVNYRNNLIRQIFESGFKKVYPIVVLDMASFIEIKAEKDEF